MHGPASPGSICMPAGRAGGGRRYRAATTTATASHAGGGRLCMRCRGRYWLADKLTKWKAARRRWHCVARRPRPINLGAGAPTLLPNPSAAAVGVGSPKGTPRRPPGLPARLCLGSMVGLSKKAGAAPNVPTACTCIRVCMD
jgi:hypothetical protein